MTLRELLPEGGFAGGQEGVFASVPAQVMRGAGVPCVVVAGFPNFVKEECAGLVGAAMQIILQAAFFPARGRDERA